MTKLLNIQDSEHGAWVYGHRAAERMNMGVEQLSDGEHGHRTAE